MRVLAFLIHSLWIVQVGQEMPESCIPVPLHFDPAPVFRISVFLISVLPDSRNGPNDLPGYKCQPQFSRVPFCGLTHSFHLASWLYRYLYLVVVRAFYYFVVWTSCIS